LTWFDIPVLAYTGLTGYWGSVQGGKKVDVTSWWRFRSNFGDARPQRQRAFDTLTSKSGVGSHNHR